MGRRFARLLIVFKEITQTVLCGEAVKLTGLGPFEVRKRADRLGPTPKPESPFSSRAAEWLSFVRPGIFGERGWTGINRSDSVRLKSMTFREMCQENKKGPYCDAIPALCLTSGWGIYFKLTDIV